MADSEDVLVELIEVLSKGYSPGLVELVHGATLCVPHSLIYLKGRPAPLSMDGLEGAVLEALIHTPAEGDDDAGSN